MFLLDLLFYLFKSLVNIFETVIAPQRSSSSQTVIDLSKFNNIINYI